jgi:hypothetical protein
LALEPGKRAYQHLDHHVDVFDALANGLARRGACGRETIERP